uniref:Uncharacterized protein LOC105632012 n=1 Tax=Rhizophora mucronata TaxID=61149 RepID=A0A2P2KMP9_RHIMU
MEEEEVSVVINNNINVNGGDGGELNDVVEYQEEEEVEVEEKETSRIFSELRPYCLELLGLLQNPAATSATAAAAIPSLFLCLCRCSSASLQPLFDYTLLPLLLLLDAAVDCRSSKKSNIEEEGVANTTLNMPQKVSDRVAEGVLQCLEELLKKCHFGSVEEMVAVMKKLTYAALLSPFEASEEFREGVIKCFRALLLGLLPCTDEVCLCRKVIGLPALLETGEMQSLQHKHSKFSSKQGKCLLAYLQSETAVAAVGHWLSLLLKAADTEAQRGHRGSAKLRIEAFLTLRVLVAKVGNSDALAFFLPGVVSQFAKVLHVPKTMISGAAGNVEAIDHAIRGLAEYLMIVLEDDANLSSLDMSLNVMVGTHVNKDTSIHSFLDELRQLPVSAKGQSKTVAEESSGEALTCTTPASGFNRNRSTKSHKDIGSLHVNRTREWIEKTSSHVDKLLTATFPHICVNPTKRVRQGLVAAIQGLLSKCIYALKDSRLMLLECLCVFVVDDCEEISVPAQQFMECLFSARGKNHVCSDVAAILNRLIEKLPKVVLGNEEALAVSCAQQLLVVIYYSGPKFLLNHLHSPITSARFLDVLSLCLSQHSAFTGALDKHISTGSSSVGYLHSIAELKASSHFISDYQRVMGAVPSQISKFRERQGHEPQYLLEAAQNNYELPHMPPWFGHVGSHKLYRALAGILRLVGLSLMTDFDNEGHMSVVTDVPLDYLRKLVSELRVEYNKESWLSWYNRTGSGQLLRQASTAACILNEMIFGLSDKAVKDLARMFQNSRDKREKVQESNTKIAAGQACAVEYSETPQSMWKVSQGRACRSHLVDCVGRILHEYLSSELWDLPEDHKSLLQPYYEVKDLPLHFFQDTAVLHQVILEGIGIFAMCLGNDFISSGYLHSSLYLLLESLVRSNSRVRSASDAVLHVLSSVSGYPTVGQLVLSNADYVIDSVCRQLLHLDLNPHVPDVLASMLSYIGVAQRILPLLEEPVFYYFDGNMGFHCSLSLWIMFSKYPSEVLSPPLGILGHTLLGFFWTLFFLNNYLVAFLFLS